MALFADGQPLKSMKTRLILAMGLLLAAAFCSCINEETVDVSPEKAETVPESVPVHVSPTSQPSQDIMSENLFADMDAKVSDILNDGTEYAVYLAYPQQSPEPYLYNSKSMRSASMIKVFILATVMEQAKNGYIDIDETVTLRSSDKVGGAGILAGYPSGSQFSLREIMKLMITESDNTATNIVIDRIGMSAINSYIAQNGYADTVLQRKMMDMDAVCAGRENYSSVRDLGEIFLRIYRHECVRRDYDEIMLDFLKGQTDKDCFPAALPGAVIAHKTGALAGLYDDGGIIYSGEKDTILVIMTENCTGEDTVIGRMKEFARTVAK